MNPIIPIRPKRSETPNKIPSTLDLRSGELAFNIHDQKIYTKSNSGNIVLMGKANIEDSDINGLNIDASTVNGYTIDKSVPVDANFNDTTYEIFTDASDGLVPSPPIEHDLNNKFLNSNSEWSGISLGSIETLNINDPQEGQKIVYSSGEWVNITEPISPFDTTFIPNVVSYNTIIPSNSKVLTVGNAVIPEGISVIVSLNSSWVVL